MYLPILQALETKGGNCPRTECDDQTASRPAKNTASALGKVVFF